MLLSAADGGGTAAAAEGGGATEGGGAGAAEGGGAAEGAAERVVAGEAREGEMHYLVRWRGAAGASHTWVAASRLAEAGAVELAAEFEEAVTAEMNAMELMGEGEEEEEEEEDEDEEDEDEGRERRSAAAEADEAGPAAPPAAARNPEPKRARHG